MEWTTIALAILLWGVVGFWFFATWVRLNTIELMNGWIPEWKIAIAGLIGGPFVWIMAALDGGR